MDTFLKQLITCFLLIKLFKKLIMEIYIRFVYFGRTDIDFDVSITNLCTINMNGNWLIIQWSDGDLERNKKLMVLWKIWSVIQSHGFDLEDLWKTFLPICQITIKQENVSGLKFFVTKRLARTLMLVWNNFLLLPFKITTYFMFESWHINFRYSNVKFRTSAHYLFEVLNHAINFWIKNVLGVMIHLMCTKNFPKN